MNGMSEDQFDGPGSADFINWEDLEGQLLLLKPKNQLYGINTDYGAKDAIEADLHVLDGPEAGEVYKNGYVFPLALQNQIKDAIGTGRFSLGRLGKGTPKKGQKPPWLLSDPTEDDKSLARRYLASDRYKQNSGPGASAKPAEAKPAAEDPWGSAPKPEPAMASTSSAPASDPWSSAASDEPPF